ncbi:GNAT family N-acetyltransferase [Thermoanaerobacterium sp. RBIITD]|uniref:GNAT family N-acetyltransferase n=1 Tax=Thermoanaerobacterium sp. RBIITD TaxID=1550240 RepID=UPI000BB919B6|nr:GNAT family N-acetyltransferase [Thermoanaerobacterium sp. RBIITD]SNX53313.1 Ribosomal protein S18 acetylase RimI [Thermoanaerobacterium sp. RBIITD]
MEIVRFEDKYIPGIVSLWNKSIDEDFVYKPFTNESFLDKFIRNPNFDYESTFVAILNCEIVGFANGIYRKTYLPGETFDTIPGYVTMVLVKKELQNKGIGKSLLKKVEDYLAGKGKKEIHIDFFNPINLEWYIPGTNKHDHPNAPGVDVHGKGYGFFKNMGYIERTKEVSMYLNLEKFSIKDEIIEKYKILNEKNITIEYYDSKKHYGLEEFFDNLKNEYWRKEINDNLALPKPYPVLVAVNNKKVIGFTGPIEVQESGRGKFTGIGVDPNYQGYGIGKALFFKLCESFKNEGASFMSIFTGIENYARRMYDAAGFKIVRQWALFKKKFDTKYKEMGDMKNG